MRCGAGPSGDPTRCGVGLQACVVRRYVATPCPAEVSHYRILLPMPSAHNTPFVMRLIGAMALDPITYEEVEADHGANGQALLVVLLSSIGAGVGARGLGSGSLRSMV